MHSTMDKERSGQRARGGFTLVEVVVTIVISGIIAGAAALILVQATRAYFDEQTRGDAHYQARLAVERIVRETRMLRSCDDISGPANPSASLAFTDINGSPVTFAVAGGNLSRGPELLAAGVVSAQPFRFLDAAGNPTTACPGIRLVEISLSVTRGQETLQLTTRVYPRNF